MSSESVGGPYVGLEDLPPDELARILTFLCLDDVHNLQKTSKILQKSCQDERVWYSMCDTTFSHLTNIRQWVDTNETTCSPSSRTRSPAFGRRHIVPAPSTYRQLYYYLRHVEQLCGFWRVIGEGPIGAFISFKWASDSLEGEEISYSSLKRKPDRTPCWRICPLKGLNIEIEWDSNDDKTTVTLKIYPRTGSDKAQLRRSSSAEAAAAVSFGGGTPQSSATLLGTSPEGSFEYAWLEFMSSNVAKPSKSRKSRGMGGTSNAPVLHHLRKVNIPTPSQRHPLAGLYVGDYGPAGFQVIRVTYDFTGKAARLIADKVVGDEGVSAGQRTWWVLAAAVGTPWPPEELEIMEDLQRIQEETAEEHALEGLEALFLEENEDEDSQSDSNSNSSDGYQNEVHDGSGNGNQQNAAFPGNASSARNPSGLSSNNKQVVGIHIGAGQVGVGNDQPHEWVEGRLWVLGDGTLKMWWMDDIQQGVALRRIDADIAGVGNGRGGKLCTKAAAVLKYSTTTASTAIDTTPNIVGRLNHVAIAVPNLEEAAATYRNALGAHVSEPQSLPEHGVKVVFVQLANAKLELLEPLGKDSPIAGYLAKNPAGGMHHICLEVAMDHVRTNTAVRSLSTDPKIGAHGNPVFFLHPKDMHGVLTEFEEINE